MALSEIKIKELEQKCNQFRLDVLRIIHKAQSGHIGGSFSVCEILTAIYFNCANVDGSKPDWDQRDRVVLCKGHAAPMIYRILAEKGFFSIEDMEKLRQIDGSLQGHPSAHHTKGIEISTGALGFGYGAALGMALAAKSHNKMQNVYAILGDGEINEGVIWETAMSASKFHADNLITILDNNQVQLDGTCNEIMPMLDLSAKFRAFGYNVLSCDGHDLQALCTAIEEAKATKGIPSIIIANTVKGKGISFMEGKNAWHGKAVDNESYVLAEKELRGENNVR